MKKVPEFLAVVYWPLPSMRSMFHSPSYSCPFQGPCGSNGPFPGERQGCQESGLGFRVQGSGV